VKYLFELSSKYLINTQMKLLKVNIILIFATVWVSCATKYKTVKPVLLSTPFSFYSNTEDSIEIFFYSDVLDHSQNRKLYRWAKRHNYTFTGVKIINRSGKFRKGFQLKFYNDNKRVVPANTAWVARKARTRTTAAPFIAIPFLLLEEAILPHDEYPRGPDGFELYPEYSGYITCEITEQDNQHRKQSNTEMAADLKSLDISYKVLPTGKPVYGIVILKNNISLDRLKVSLQ